jgi:hypothetical protein
VAAAGEIGVSEFLQVRLYFIPFVSISLKKYSFFSIVLMGFMILVTGYIQTNIVFAKETSET